MALGRLLKVRTSYLVVLGLAVAGYFAHDAYFNWKVMSSLPVMPARERFAFPYLAAPVPRSVTANGVTYEISPRRIEWVPVVYVEKDYRSGPVFFGLARHSAEHALRDGLPPG